MTSTREFVPLAPASHIISSVFIKLHLLHPLLVTLHPTSDLSQQLAKYHPMTMTIYPVRLTVKLSAIYREDDQYKNNDILHVLSFSQLSP